MDGGAACTRREAQGTSGAVAGCVVRGALVVYDATL